MATNYSKGDVTATLENSTLDPFIVSAIIKSLGPKVASNNIPVDGELSSSDLFRQNLVTVNDPGVFDLTDATRGDVARLKSLIFSTNESVDLTFDQGRGSDAFRGWVVTNGGDDTIKLSGNNVKVSSGDGDDAIITGNGNDSIVAGTGNDSITTSGGRDTVEAGSGDDSISTGGGSDSVLTGGGNDSVYTGDGNDYVSTNSGDVLIVTGDGRDTVLLGGVNGFSLVDTGNQNDIVRLGADFSGFAAVDGGAGNFDKLDFRNFDITSVSQDFDELTITLSDGSEISAINFERFVYDNNGAAQGGIRTVGIDDFLTHEWPIV
jgi:Ca2+-binding RTX toxin-like protein